MGRVLIAGCGYVGRALARRLVEDGHEVHALRRGEGVPDGTRPIRADLTKLLTLNRLPINLDTVVYCAAADARTPTDYHRAYVQGPRNLWVALQRRGGAPRRFIFVSSSAVYGQQGGEWVDETSPTAPWHFSGRLLLEAEQACAEFACETTILRYSGIYGPGRMRWLERAATDAPLSPLARVRHGNRIHLEDCVGVLRHVLMLPRPERLYLASDSEPATAWTIAEWLAREHGRPAPTIAFAALRQEREHGNKRCDNRRLLASGYRFVYPTFREGLAAALVNMA